MTPLNITAFLDGRPGHEKQTKGVLCALGELTDIQLTYKSAPAQSAVAQLKQWLGFILIQALPSKPKPSYGDGVDLVIGTGSRIHLPMIFYRRRHGGWLVTCMTPDLLLRDRFDLCLVPQHDSPTETAKIFITVGPPVPVTDLGGHDDTLGLILVGGVDHKSHHWDSEGVLAQIRTIVNRQAGVNWTISSSPRTPEDMIHLLEQYAADMDGVAFFRSQETPPGWIETAYAQNKKVWVTADSISMIYEALSAGCQVGILPIKWKHGENKFQRSIDFLAQQQRIVTYDRWLEGHRPSGGTPLNEARRCAEEILRRWWPERLIEKM